jgi:hypothetical protein
VTSARLAARCVELLGPVDGPVAVVARPRLRAAIAARVRLAEDGMPAAGAVCAFLGDRADPAVRRTRLLLVAARLAPGAPLVVVDHNRPRHAIGRVAVALALLARGHRPSRAAYPTARELHDHGLAIGCLRLAAGERIQLVRAKRR